jgi:hypothetical protein
MMRPKTSTRASLVRRAPGFTSSIADRAKCWLRRSIGPPNPSGFTPGLIAERELFWQLPIELACQRKEGAMHLHTFRDENRSRHFDLIGHHWSIDLVTVTAAGLLVVGFACALVALLVH